MNKSKEIRVDEPVFFEGERLILRSEYYKVFNSKRLQINLAIYILQSNLFLLLISFAALIG